MNRNTFSRRAFTLIEMLVSISILSLMLVAMSQITSLSEQAWRMEQNRIDNYTKARAMLNMMTDDLEHAVFRGDLPIFGTGAPAAAPTVSASGFSYFPTSTTAFTTAFYTRQPGLPTTSVAVRDVSLVSYNLSTSSTEKIILQRKDLYVPWTGGAANLVFQGNMATPLANVTAQEVAPGVVGFGIAFRRMDGTLIAPMDSSGTGYTGYNSTNPVVAIDVCLAVIGKQTLAELTPGQVTSIQTTLASAVSATSEFTNKSIKATWDQQTLPTLLTASNAKDLGAGLKTFECWVACQPF
jgi:prepilin-type N-terminal cleavage/methylation domain-containing protein